MKLAIRIIAVTLLTTLLMLSTAIIIQISATYQAFEEQQREAAANAAAAMVEPLREVWDAEGADGVDRVLGRENVMTHSGRHLRWVWFEKGAPVANQPLLPEKRWPAPDDYEPVSIIDVSESEGRHLHTYITVPLVMGRHGGLEVTEALEPLDQLTWQRLQIDLAALGAMAVACFGLAYGTGLLWISRPLNALVVKTRRIAEGDFAAPLGVVGRGELGELATSLNEMSEQLARQRATIQAEMEQRIAALQQLRHADRLSTVGRLAAGIAHEIGTPLNVVAGRAALIASAKVTGAEAQASAATIKGEADRITTIVRQLLDFARQRRPQRAVTDVYALVRESVNLLQDLVSRRNVQIDIKPCIGDAQASVDPTQIQQVLINLLTNAIDAMPQGGTIGVEVSGAVGAPPGSAPDQPWIQLGVRDSGAGIEESVLEHIFEPFFTTKDVGQGTGLGLAIAYGIIQEHGGCIEVASQIGHGTSFAVYLPAGA